ncbi:unnamed protein product [Mortierella alpina]
MSVDVQTTCANSDYWKSVHAPGGILFFSITLHATAHTASIASTSAHQGTCTSSIRNALALSEIRSLVGIFLLGCNSDLIHCMLVCKDWRPDFRRLLYHDLQLTGRTQGAIISLLQWRAYGPYTRSLAIEEPTVSHQGAKSNLKKKYPKSRDSQDGSGSSRSPDFNLDSALHCPNLQHLTVKLSTRNLALCCWTRQDDERGLGHRGSLESLDEEEQERNSIFNTTVALRYGQKMDAYFVKTSNRILALLHHHPQLKSFNWMGVSDAHMVHLGRYLLKRNPAENPMHLVELRLEHLKASVQELNRIIVNCPKLLRLYLRTLMLETASNWPELNKAIDPIDAAPTPVHPSQAGNEEQEPQQSRRPTVLDLQQIQSLRLDKPHFPPLHLVINGPSLRHLQLAMCQAPPGFNITTEAHLNHPPADQAEAHSQHTSPAFSVSWTCPQLTSFTHDQAPLPAAVFYQNLLDSCQNTLTSLALTSHTLEPTFIPSLISNYHHCSILTHLDLTNSAWIKSTDVHLLLCHCPELLDFMGPQGVLWGEDLFRSQDSWACVKLRRLRLLICLARPDSELWEISLRDDAQRDPGQELGQSGAVPLFFPMQRILRIQSDDVVIMETLDPELEGATAASEEEEEEEAEQDAQVSEEDLLETQQGQGQPTSSTSNLIWLRDVQDSVLNQLSKLTELESLDLSGGLKTFRFLVEHPRGIPWALDAGLDRLKGLSKMKELVVTGWEDKMARQEVKWMKQHWPQLRSIINKSGNLTDGVIKTGVGSGSNSGRHSRAWTRKTRAGDDLVVGWLAFEICLAQEWPERFSHASFVFQYFNNASQVFKDESQVFKDKSQIAHFSVKSSFLVARSKASVVQVFKFESQVPKFVWQVPKFVSQVSKFVLLVAQFV